jgi:hypothetical protein
VENQTDVSLKHVGGRWKGQSLQKNKETRMEKPSDLLYRIAERVKKLADYKLRVLRDFAPLDCNPHSSRGEIIEVIIIEEFEHDMKRLESFIKSNDSE